MLQRDPWWTSWKYPHATLAPLIRLHRSLNFLFEFVELFGGLLQLSGEDNDLRILVVAVNLSPVGNHVLVHLVETG